jgi:hypothetical protein
MIFDQMAPIINGLREDTELFEEAEELHEALRGATNSIANVVRTMEDRLHLPLDRRLTWF